MLTFELSVVAHVSRAFPPGGMFIGLAPTRMFEPLSGVTPTTSEACAVAPVADVAVAVYSVAVDGLTLMPPLVPFSGAPLIVTEVAFVLLQESGANVSAGFVGTCGTVVGLSSVSTSVGPPQPFAWR